MDPAIARVSLKDWIEQSSRVQQQQHESQSPNSSSIVQSSTGTHPVELLPLPVKCYFRSNSAHFRSNPHPVRTTSGHRHFRSKRAYPLPKLSRHTHKHNAFSKSAPTQPTTTQVPYTNTVRYMFCRTASMASSRRHTVSILTWSHICRMAVRRAESPSHRRNSTN